eukprot:6470990-Amphidinium_carterae.1
MRHQKNKLENAIIVEETLHENHNGSQVKGKGERAESCSNRICPKRPLSIKGLSRFGLFH